MIVQIGMAVVLALAILLIPLGLPGAWIQLAVLAGGVLAGWVGWLTFGALAALVALAELGELLVLRSMGRRYGGSRKAFWGAVAGGFLGLFVGVPVPLVGPIITAFLGTFVGAGAVTWLETRSVRRAGRVGWGLLLARTLAVGLKVGAAAVVLVVGTGALLL
ncbi:MAG: DUF456 family protein [Gemmatimonadetes bacterium]|nr:DUF456 family protein [Gemmatimonadota bacterium]